ncbi:hypothetical protein VW35_13580 [Devosia soli]|uniref:Tyr recombinase domain-containing protein n=2 Tax=Devosia soli TaxID=361041 RepID=A0A0F5L938_9HYPH|nr:hypothetical protein VW35_13580 [Devosia soli]
MAYQAADRITHSVARLGYYRRLAIAEMIYGSGLSSRDLVDLKSSDLESASVASGYFALRNADGVRLVPITTRALEAVTTWRQVAEGAGIDTSDWLFPSLKSPSQLLLKDITRAIRDFGNDTDVFEKDQLNASTLRWAFANHLISNGADIRIVAYAMDLKDLRAMKQFTSGSPDFGDGELPAQ